MPKIALRLLLLGRLEEILLLRPDDWYRKNTVAVRIPAATL